MQLCSKHGFYFVRVYKNGETVLQSQNFLTPEEANAWAAAYSKANR